MSEHPERKLRAPSTYRYRDPDKRREYLREYMKKRRAKERERASFDLEIVRRSEKERDK